MYRLLTFTLVIRPVFTLLWGAVHSCFHHCRACLYSHKKEAGKKQASRALSEVLPKGRFLSMGRVLDRGKVTFLPHFLDAPSPPITLWMFQLEQVTALGRPFDCCTVPPVKSWIFMCSCLKSAGNKSTHKGSLV